jgi:hypothetical protein
VSLDSKERARTICRRADDLGVRPGFTGEFLDMAAWVPVLGFLERLVNALDAAKKTATRTND